MYSQKKCKSCGHVNFFDLDDHMVCKSCGGVQFEELKENNILNHNIISNLKTIVGTNKMVFLIIGSLIFAFLFFKFICHKKGTFNITVKAYENEGYFEFKMQDPSNKNIELSCKKVKNTLVKVSDIADIYLNNNGKLTQIKLIDDRYYPCTSGLYKFEYKVKNSEIILVKYKDEKHIELKNGPNKNVDCPPELEPLSFNKHVELKNCQVFLSTNYDKKKEEVYFSINGRNGPYEKKKLWDIKDIQIIAIYAYIEGIDTSSKPPVEYELNGNSYLKGGCDCDPTKNKDLAQKFYQLANSYGKDPGNTNLFSSLKRMAKNNNAIIKINGKVLKSGWQQLLNEFIRMFGDDPDIVFKLKAIPACTNCNVESFEFIN